MSLSYEITHVSSLSTESVTLSVPEKSAMVLQSSDTDPKTGRNVATYSIDTGDVSHPANVVISVDPLSAGGKTRYGSIVFKTWATQTNSITGEVDYWPVQASVSFVLASDAPVQLTDFMKLLGAAFAFTYASVTTGARDTVWANKLLFGSPVVA